VISDSIELDTRAVIEAVEFEGEELRAPGDLIHLGIVTGEPGGEATVSVEGVFSEVRLVDDGSAGDRIPQDGTYERALSIPATASALVAEVRGSFVDRAGNMATGTGARSLSIRRRPSSVTLAPPVVVEPPEPASVKLQWTVSAEPNFARYRLFRGISAQVDSLHELLHQEDSRDAVEFTDTDIVEGRSYYYRLYVTNADGGEAPSAAVRADVANLRPPQVVTLQAISTGTHRLGLSWTPTTDRDFAFYRIYRNDDGAVGEDDDLVSEIEDQSRSFWDDGGLRENTTYYYRLYVIDQGGLRSRSTELETETRNLEPSPVILNSATDVDSTEVTLSWSESAVHDFARYGLYRDRTQTVTTASTLVVELDDETFNSFRDAELESGQRYYYRVFVFDDKDEYAGSNTISVATTARTGAGPR
jgi:hypothetical protein